MNTDMGDELGLRGPGSEWGNKSIPGGATGLHKRKVWDEQGMWQGSDSPSVAVGCLVC